MRSAMLSVTGRIGRRGVCLAVVVLAIVGSGYREEAASARASAASVGTLSVSSDPAVAAVYVDGRFVGETPLTLPSLEAGDHRVRLVKDGYLENSRIIKVSSGKVETVQVRLTARAMQGAAGQAAGVTNGAAGQGGLHIVVIEGEDAVNIIQQKTAVRPIVEVRDRNNLPVAGAAVTFTIGGGHATFGGLQALTVTTNAAGRAVAMPLTAVSHGAVQIQIQAAFQGQLATATMSQTVAAAGAASGAGGGAGGAAGGGGLSTLAITGIAAGAVGAVVAVKVATASSPTCTFSVSPTSLMQSSGAGSATVNLTSSPAGCSPATWSATSNSSFITLTPASGTGNATVTLTVAANSGSARTGTLTIAGQTVTLAQDPSCTFAVSPTSFTTVMSVATTLSVTVSVSPSGCSPTTWTATGGSFVTVSPGSGSGSGTVTLTVPANTGAQRSTTVTIAGQVVPVTQLVVAIPCNSQNVAGGDAADTRTIQLGKTSGTFTFSYDTQIQQDRMLVIYQGTTLFDTGCVGTGGTVSRSISYSGTATTVTVQVIPNCAGGFGTAWSYTLFCPS